MDDRPPNPDQNMENPTEFDLNTAIRDWRNHLSQSPRFRPENLEELESHLRDSAVALRDIGLSDEEAFFVATRRVGGAKALEPEFAKINRREVWLHRAFWMLLGIQLWALVVEFSRVTVDAVVLGGLGGLNYQFSNPASSTLPAHFAPAILLTFARIGAVFACIAACCWLAYRKEAGILKRGASLLRRPFFVALAVISPCLILLGTRLVEVAETMLLAKWVPVTAFGSIHVTRQLSSFVVLMLLTLILAAVTVSLARRRLRLRGNL